MKFRLLVHQIEFSNTPGINGQSIPQLCLITYSVRVQCVKHIFFDLTAQSAGTPTRDFYVFNHGVKWTPHYKYHHVIYDYYHSVTHPWYDFGFEILKIAKLSLGHKLFRKQKAEKTLTVFIVSVARQPVTRVYKTCMTMVNLRPNTNPF